MSRRRRVLAVIGVAPLGLAIAPLVCAAPAWAASSHTAYVTNFGSNSVTPIDTATNTPGIPIPVGAVSIEPGGVAITPDGKTAYVTNGNSNTVTPIDTATNMAGTPIPVGVNAFGVAITPDGKTAYVTNAGSDSVTPIDTATNTAGTAIPVGSGPFGVAITPDGKTAYVTNAGSDSVTPIDTATNTPGTQIPVGLSSSPGGVAITPDGKTVYVTTVDSVTPIDTATNTVGSPIPVGVNAFGVAVAPDGKTAYSADSNSGTLTPIDTATNTPGTPILIGLASNPTGVAITPDGKTGYVTTTGSVTPVDTATSTPGTAIPDSGVPVGVAITPDQGPVAAFQTTAAPARQASSLDGSTSSDPDGTVASYRWDFGDGATETTTSPTTAHTYATPGTYMVMLTVTDDAGCSTSLIFTGQTVSCHGGPAASTTNTITVAPSGAPASPPKHIKLSVSPHSTVAGKRACYSFKATSGGRGVSGVTIRFAGHTTKTSSHGRARICETLSRHGTYTAHAAKSGYRSATARVTVKAKPKRKPKPTFTG